MPSNPNRRALADDFAGCCRDIAQSAVGIGFKSTSLHDLGQLAWTHRELIEAALRVPQPTYQDGIEAAVRKQEGRDARLRDVLGELYTFLRECWRGTGSSSEDGSASNDYRVWADRVHVELRTLASGPEGGK